MLVRLKEGRSPRGVVSARPGAVESFLGVAVSRCRPVGGADPIGGNVLYGGPTCAVDFGSGGASSIARFCFLGIGGSVSLTYDFKPQKKNQKKTNKLIY